MTNDVMKLAMAMDFAARAHVHQRRKGSDAEPYINHATDVAHRLAIATAGTDATLMMAGLLHDTLEDTATTYEELAELFGQELADLVREVTDDMRIAKPERKLLQVANAPYKSARAKMLRIADKTSNLYSVLHSPAPHWDIERKREYFEWAKRVVDGCRGVNDKLEAMFDVAYQKKNLLTAPPPPRKPKYTQRCLAQQGNHATRMPID